MDNNNLNDMIKKAQEMINNNQIPPELQSLVKNFNENSQDTSNQANGVGSQNYNGSSNNNQSNVINRQNYGGQSTNQNYNNPNESNSMPNIDMATLMKMQNIMSKMQSNGDNDMSRLLSSLKPYLRDEKKGKIDEYMKLVKMGQMTKILESMRW